MKDLRPAPETKRKKEENVDSQNTPQRLSACTRENKREKEKKRNLLALKTPLKDLRPALQRNGR